MMHKCNKCIHQARVNCESGLHEYCLALNIEVEEKVKSCTEFIDASVIQEPDEFTHELDVLLKLLKGKPTMSQVKKFINRLKVKIDILRLWGQQKHKPKVPKL